MNAEQFYHKVVDMRFWQKEYFSSRSRESLTFAKALEKEIDDEITRVTAILGQRKQQ